MAERLRASLAVGEAARAGDTRELNLRTTLQVRHLAAVTDAPPADITVLDDTLQVVATLVGGVTVHDVRGGDR